MDALADKVKRCRQPTCPEPPVSDCDCLLAPSQCVYLMSGQASQQLVIVAQRKLETQLDGLKIKYVKVDGMGALSRTLPPRPCIASRWQLTDLFGGGARRAGEQGAPEGALGDG